MQMSSETQANTTMNATIMFVRVGVFEFLLHVL